MKKTRMRGIPDNTLNTILAEFHTVLNQHAQVINAQKNKLSELHHRVVVLEEIAGVVVQGTATVEVVDEIAPPLTEEQTEFIQRRIEADPTTTSPEQEQN